MTFTCTGCGRATPDDDTGCLTCDLCEGCTPAAGRCPDCDDMRREDHNDWLSDYRRENEDI